MSAAEIAHRVKEKIKKTAARNRLEGWARYQCPGDAPILPGLQARISAKDHAFRQLMADQSRLTLAGEFRALGQAWSQRSPADLFPPELWRLDPVTGKLWPGFDLYCFSIPYRHERGLGDIKYVWEVNRLQFLQPLAVHAFLTGDAQSLSAIESAIESWYVANPPFRGICWNSGIELALRSISLLIVTSLVGTRLSKEAVNRCRAILCASLFWIARYPSRFSSANNHLIAEAAGEFLISIAMPELPRAALTQAKAWGVLEREATKQFHADGVPAEQSPSYGAFSAEFLLLCDQTARASGASLAPSVERRLEEFANFIHWLAASEDGHVPSIGDDDEGRVLAPGFVEDYAFFVARSIGRPDVSSGVKVFPGGGYTAIRDGSTGHDLRIVLDHGPLGYLSIAAHGHADALAIVVALDGRPLFVDPGTYLYHSGAEWRDWFRSTPAHNTLNIKGASQSVMAGPFNWSRKANAKLEQVAQGRDWSVTASHDGYVGRYDVRHRRTLAASGSGFCIHDQLVGNGERDAEIVFQLGPDYSVRDDGARIVISRAGAKVASISFGAPGAIAVNVGKPMPDGGWVSPSFGVMIPAPRIVWRGKIPDSGIQTSVDFPQALSILES